MGVDKTVLPLRDLENDAAWLREIADSADEIGSGGNQMMWPETRENLRDIATYIETHIEPRSVEQPKDATDDGDLEATCYECGQRRAVHNSGPGPLHLFKRERRKQASDDTTAERIRKFVDLTSTRHYIGMRAIFDHDTRMPRLEQVPAIAIADLLAELDK